MSRLFRRRRWHGPNLTPGIGPALAIATTLLRRDAT